MVARGTYELLKAAKEHETYTASYVHTDVKLQSVSLTSHLFSLHLNTITYTHYNTLFINSDKSMMVQIIENQH